MYMYVLDKEMEQQEQKVGTTCTFEEELEGNNFDGQDKEDTCIKMDEEEMNNEKDSIAGVEKEDEMDRKNESKVKECKIEEMKEEEEEEGDDDGEGSHSEVDIPVWFFQESSHQNLTVDVSLQHKVKQGGAHSSSSSSSALSEGEVKMPSPRLRCCQSWHPWFFIGLGWLPIVVGILLSLSFVIPYCIAVGLNHVSPGFPYISDSGTLPPESCIFGQLLNMAAGLGLAGIYIKYKQVELYSGDFESTNRLLLVNKIALVLGAVACFGMSLVANFQVGNVVAVHFIGAFLLFTPGAVYGFLHAWVSYKMYPRHASLAVCHIRLVLSIIIAVFFSLCMIFTLVSLTKTSQSGLILHWKPEDGGYPEHIVATTSEWVMGVAFLFYFFTFIREFQRITIQAELKHHLVYDGLVETNSYPPVADYDNSFTGTI